jgi:hypothetical protein
MARASLIKVVNVSDARRVMATMKRAQSPQIVLQHLANAQFLSPRRAMIIWPLLERTMKAQTARKA